MKGLIIKELYGVKTYNKTLLLLMASTVILNITLPQGNIYIPSMLMVYLMTVVISLFSLDETAKWDAYAVTLPVGRRQIVSARYLVVLILCALTVLLALGINCILALFLPQKSWFIETSAASGSIILVFIINASIFIPLIYQFGLEKVRIIISLVVLLPFMGIFFAMPILEPMLETIKHGALILIVGVVALLVVLGYFVSWCISCRIYKQKEF